MSSDDPLVRRLIARDGDAWKACLDRYGGRIAGACRRALLNAGRPTDEAAVADAAADVVRRLLDDDARALRLHRPGTPLGPYLGVLAYSRTLDALRRERPDPSRLGMPDPALAASAAAEAAERSERLRKSLSELDPREAEALRLFHLEGLPYAEISRRTGIAEGALGMVLTRAREHLRKALGPDFLESS